MEAPSPAVLLFLAAVLVPIAGGGLPGSSVDAGPADVVRVDVAPVNTLVPERGKAVDVTVTLCAPAGGVAAGPRQLEVVAADAPAWLTMDVEPDAFTFSAVLPGECDTVRGVAHFNATRDAPAFETQRVIVEARDAHDGRTHASQENFVHVGYHGALTVTPERARVPAALNAPVDVPLSVVNRGNAATTFLVDVVHAPEDVSVMRPQPLVLPPGESGTLDVTFLLPEGSGQHTRRVDLLVTSHARMDHEAHGGSAVVHVILDPESGPTSGLTVPAPAPLLAVVAAGLIVAKSRRHRATRFKA